MLTVNKLVPQGRGLAPVLLKRASHVALDWDVRCKSRFDATRIGIHRHIPVFWLGFDLHQRNAKFLLPEVNNGYPAAFAILEVTEEVFALELPGGN